MQNLAIQIKEDIIAVYFLWINDEIVYIGKSTNLKNRLSQHRQNCNDSEYSWKKEINKITYFECENLTDLDILETYLINEYQPVYNTEKQFGEKSTFRIQIPKEKELILNKKSNISFKDLANNLIDGLISVEEVKEINPFLANVYLTLGSKKIKTFCYNKKLLLNELNNNTIEIKDLIRKKLIEQLQKNEFYTLTLIKNLLENIYLDLKINKNAKATDIKKYLNVKETSKHINNKKVKGYVLI